jgi:hypothetical protein
VNRIYHTWDKWECYKYGFFEVRPPKGLNEEDCINLYKQLLQDIPEFKRIMTCIINEWEYSCQHNLTNERMNRIAWMGQASLSYKYKIPARYRGGYHLLSKEEQLSADEAALEIINIWMERNGHEKQSFSSIESKSEVDLY